MPRRRSSASDRIACRSSASCSATWSPRRARAPRSIATSCCRSSRGQRPRIATRAGDVLDALVDARLLTSYELPAIEGETTGRRRIEIVHESLLTAWPRLVRWQTQDQDGAQLRDQFRQAARLWEERGKPEDLLWTGTSFREYELWRERYAGTLSASEDTFARAMTTRTLAPPAPAPSRRFGCRHCRARRGDRHGRAVAAKRTRARGGHHRRPPRRGATAVRAGSARDRAASAPRWPTRWRASSGTTTPTCGALPCAPCGGARPPSSLARTDSAWAGPTSLTFSSDGDWLAGVNDQDRRCPLVDERRFDAREIPAAGQPRAISRGAILRADGRSFVVTMSDSIRIHALDPGQRDPADQRDIPLGTRSRRVGRHRRLCRANARRARAAPDQVLLRCRTVRPKPRVASGRRRRERRGLRYRSGRAQWLLGIHGGSLFEISINELERAQPRLVVRGADDPIVGFHAQLSMPRASTPGTSPEPGRVGRARPGHPSWTALRRACSIDSIGAQLDATDAGWPPPCRTRRWTSWTSTGPSGIDSLKLRSGGRPMAVAIDPSRFLAGRPGQPIPVALAPHASPSARPAGTRPSPSGPRRRSARQMDRRGGCGKRAPGDLAAAFGISATNPRPLTSVYRDRRHRSDGFTAWRSVGGGHDGRVVARPAGWPPA